MTQAHGPSRGDATSGVEQAVVILQRVIANLVSNPEAIEIGIKVDSDGTHLRLRLAAPDREKILASPRTLASLQRLVAAVGRRSGSQFLLDGDLA